MKKGRKETERQVMKRRDNADNAEKGVMFEERKIQQKTSDE